MNITKLHNAVSSPVLLGEFAKNLAWSYEEYKSKSRNHLNQICADIIAPLIGNTSLVGASRSKGRMGYIRVNWWCRDVVVKRANSQRRGCEFESYMIHNKISISEEGNGKPPHKIHLPGKNSKPCLWFLL